MREFQGGGLLCRNSSKGLCSESGLLVERAGCGLFRVVWKLLFMECQPCTKCLERHFHVSPYSVHSHHVGD